MQGRGLSSFNTEVAWKMAKANRTKYYCLIRFLFFLAVTLLTELIKCREVPNNYVNGQVINKFTSQ